MAFYKNILGSVLVVAPLPPSEYATASQAAELVHCLKLAGKSVKTASAVTPAYCETFLHFFPKRRFEPVLTELLQAKHELTVIFPQALAFENISKTRWKDGRIEEFRRLKFLAKLAFLKPKVVIAYPTNLNSAAKVLTLFVALSAKIARPLSVRLIRKKNRGINLASRILRQNQPVPEPALAEESVFGLVGNVDNMRLTPNWLRHSVAKFSGDDDLAQEIKALQAVVGRLKDIQQPFHSPLKNPVFVTAHDGVDDPSQAVPVSRFMQHLRHKYRKETRFPLNHEEGRLKLLRWYMTEVPEKVQHPLPLPKQVFEAFKADCKNRAELRQVAALRQPESRDVILPAYFLSLKRCFPKKYGSSSLRDNTGRIAFAFQVIVDHARFQTDTDFIGESLNSYFNSRIGGNLENPTRFQLIAAVLGHMPTRSQLCLTEPWQSLSLSDWFGSTVANGYPLLQKFTGLSSEETGSALRITGTNSIDTGIGRNQMMSKTALANTTTSRPVFLHHTNADEIPAQLCRHNQAGAFHIGYLLWELENLPAAHNLASQLLDEIWTPSKFVQNIYEQAFDRPVTMIGKGFDLPDVAPVDLSTYGMEPGQTVFLACFDMHSSVARKNPLAAIRAFQMTFPANPNMRFILKTTPPPRNHWGDPGGQMAKINQIALRDPRIVIDQRMLPFEELLGLIRAVDCVVSSHRSEGFGYFPAYALNFGKPVISTDYSGTRDFCTEETSFPVEYNMQKVKQSEIIFPVKNASWAEIIPEKLSAAMHDVAGDLTGANLRAQAGQELMHSFYSSHALAARYAARLKELGLTSQNLTSRSHNVLINYGTNDSRAANRARDMSPVAES